MDKAYAEILLISSISVLSFQDVYIGKDCKLDTSQGYILDSHL